MNCDEIPNGAIADPRTEEQKNNDYSHKEILGAGITTVTWEPKTSWTKLLPRNQISSSSCGGQAAAKSTEAFFSLQCSACPIYRARANFPGEGMFLQDIGNILKNKKTCSEVTCPSLVMTEGEMNAAVIPQILPYGIDGYYFLSHGAGTDMDALATSLEKGHCLIFLISSNSQEYTSVPVSNGLATTFGHFVAAVPKNYLLWNGEKSVVIDDSAMPNSTLPNSLGQRIFTESFLKARCVEIMAVIPTLPTVPTPKPQHSFLVDLAYGMMHNVDVKAFQDVLKYEGFLAKSIDSTGNFLEATKSAAMKWQQAHAKDVLVPAGLIYPTGYVGKYSRAYLNKTYN